MTLNWNEMLLDVTTKAEEWLDSYLDGCKAIGTEPEDFETLWYAMADSDEVTGNASGSYTCNRAQSIGNVAGIMWDLDFDRALAEHGLTETAHEHLGSDPEAFEVVARYCALADAYGDLESAFELDKERAGYTN